VARGIGARNPANKCGPLLQRHAEMSDQGTAFAATRKSHHRQTNRVSESLTSTKCDKPNTLLVAWSNGRGRFEEIVRSD
jgi:hypothetical protein